MKNVLVLSSYGPPILHPFGESMRDILINSFKDIGIKCSYKYYDAYNLPDVYDTTIIFLMPPDLYLKVSDSIPKRDNMFILWNLELFPVGRPGEVYGPKHARRKNAICGLAYDHDTDAVWLYDEEQLSVVDNSSGKYRFVPIGYHECLEPKSEVEKRSGRYFVMLGYFTSRRKLLWSVIDSKLRKMRVPFIKPRFVTNKMFKNTKDTIKNIARFRVGMDTDSTKFCLGHVRWHRIMCYAGADVALVSNTDLGKYGFIDRQHYLLVRTAEEFAIALDGLVRSKGKTDVLSANLKQKVKEEFHMTTILKKALEGFNV